MVADDGLLAPRLRAAARRARAISKDLRIAVGEILYERESRRVWCAGRQIRLTRTEEALLDCLFWYAPEPATIGQLTTFAWGQPSCARGRNLVHVYMSRLRKKLSGSRDVVIHTLRGVGYGFAELSAGAG